MGVKQNSATSEILNKTLKKVAMLLNDNCIDDWFISYGTLLGIIRNNSCIDHDDDVDIIIDHKYFDAMKKFLEDDGFEIWNATYPYDKGVKNTTFLLKTKPTADLASVDFYFAVDKGDGRFDDVWNNIIWNDCLCDGEFITRDWNGVALNIPNNCEKKLEAKYGNWKVRSNAKAGGSSPKNLP